MVDVAAAFEEKGEAQASPDLLAQINTAAKELIALEGAKKQMEEDLKALSGTLQALRTTRMPDLMMQAGMTDMTVDGHRLVLEDFVSGSLPKEPDKRETAVKLLESYGAGGLMVTEVSMTFSKGDDELAKDVVEHITEHFHNRQVVPVVEATIHPQTLMAFARERIKGGGDIDLPALGLFNGKVTKVKPPRKTKGQI